VGADGTARSEMRKRRRQGWVRAAWAAGVRCQSRIEVRELIAMVREWNRCGCLTGNAYEWGAKPLVRWPAWLAPWGW
jgi:hypothetical protein